MNKKHIAHLVAIISLLFAACKNSTEEKMINDSSEIAIGDTKPTNGSTTTDGRFCFMSALNKDTTTVQFVIVGDKVSGNMRWNPYQKDGAKGTLSGSKKSNDELELVYDYMIEGNQQTETKIMKIEKGELLIKKGELEDPKNDGHLRYKDVSKASFTEKLSAVDCQ